MWLPFTIGKVVQWWVFSFFFCIFSFIIHSRSTTRRPHLKKRRKWRPRKAVLLNRNSKTTEPNFVHTGKFCVTYHKKFHKKQLVWEYFDTYCISWQWL
jgi:hypothetical protein